MSSHTHNGPRPSASTRAAAQACLARMAARRSGAAHQHGSRRPRWLGDWRALLADAGDASNLSLIGPGADDVPDAGLAAAWLLRFGGAEPGHENRCCISCAPRRQRVERGLLGNAGSRHHPEPGGNHAVALDQGVMPDVPVWLNAYLPCTP